MKEIYKYRYLFPYEKIPYQSQILIYGAGNTGIEYYNQLMITNYAKIVAFVDQNYERYSNFTIPVYPIHKIKELKYDYIVIAMKNKVYIDAIIADLREIGIDISKIIYEGERKLIKHIESEWIGDQMTSGFSYEKKGISMAIKISSGLGDVVIVKSLLVRLIEFMPEVMIDIYGSGITEFVKAFYFDLKNINRVFEPKEATYENYEEHYMLSMLWKEYLMINTYDRNRILKVNSQAVEILDTLKKAISDYGITQEDVNSIYVHIMRAKYSSRNIYSAAYFGDILGMRKEQAQIPIKEAVMNQIKETLAGDYITVNYGNGAGFGKSSKLWAYENFCELVKRIKMRYESLKIVQVSGKNEGMIKGCDLYYMGENLEKVKCILKKSLLHIDIEGGLVHLATLLGTKCIVLFGPTQEWFFGYRQNINLKPDVCGACAWLYETPYKCAAGYEKPRCMASITVERVFEAASNEIKAIEKEAV